MLTQEYLRQIIDYNPETGIVVSKIYRANNKIKPGDILGTPKGKNDHLMIMLDGVNYYLHTVIWVYMEGPIPNGLEVDHSNLVRNDNTWNNLRLATREQQMANRRKQKHNTSGYKGVSFHVGKQRYQARISVDSELIYLGTFDSKEDAYLAYCEAAKKYHGEFARLK